MITSWARIASVSVVLLLASCGGGGDGGGAGGGAGGAGAGVFANAPPLTGAPTAVLTASQQTAAGLAGAANTGAAAMATMQGFNNLPIAVQLRPPTGVILTDTIDCTGGGSVLETDNLADPNGITVGDTANFVLNACVEFGTTFNGMADLQITRYVDDDNLTTTFTASNISAVIGGTSYGPASFAGQIDINAGQVSYAFNVNGTTVIGNGVASRNGDVVTITSGTVRVSLSAGGFVEIRFSNWIFSYSTGIPTSGSATVTAANGDTANVTVQGDGYHWIVTVNGIPSNFVVPF